MEYNLYSTENIFWYLFFFLFPSSLGFILYDHTTEILNGIAPQSKQHNIANSIPLIVILCTVITKTTEGIALPLKMPTCRMASI